MSRSCLMIWFCVLPASVVALSFGCTYTPLLCVVFCDAVLQMATLRWRAYLT